MNRKQRRKRAKAGRPASGEAPDPAILHEAGVQAYRAGDLDKATALIRQAIAINRDVPSFHYNLAIVLKAGGALEAAAASYEQAIALKPDHADAHNNLGNVWKALGQLEKAQASFARALHCNPGNADTHYNLGILCSDLGERGQAEQHFRRSLACDPHDRNGAGILLAHLGASVTPDRTPHAQLLSIYDVRSRFWDQERSYFGADLVAGGLRRHAAHSRLDILDIGCGTGLVGARVRDLANRLDGVDISPAMLEKAKAKAVYDRLFQAELASFMAQQGENYDAVLGAATLIHFGELAGLFQAASRALRGKGLFVFTFFPHDGADYAVAAHDRLARSGCFRHSAIYVERLASQTGFRMLELENAIHEHDQQGNPVPGVVAVLQAEAKADG